MIVFLVGILALCPALACSSTAASHTSSCCHKPGAKTVADCPYSILQKSKTSPTATNAKWVVSIVRAPRIVALPITSQTVLVSSRLADVTGLFLRNRVLLI